MPSAEEFELLELLHRDLAETWLAIEKASGRRLLFHKFSKKSGLRDRLLSMAPDHLIMLVSAGDEGDSYIVVTHDVPPLRHFREWVENRSAPAPGEAFDPDKTQRMPSGAARLFPLFDPPEGAAAQRPVPSAPQRPTAGPGEFTRMFKTAPVRDEPNLPPASPRAAEPGEFTRMFKTPPVRDEPNLAPAAPAPPRATEPGEFTRMFKTPPVRNEPNLPPAAPAPPRAAEPGEFTRMFKTPSVRNEPNSVPEAPAPPRAAEPGEFTRMFKTPSVRNEPNSPSAAKSTPMRGPSPATSNGPGEFTRNFSNPLPTTPLAEKLETAHPESAGKTPPRAASEFTKMFGGPAEQAPSGGSFAPPYAAEATEIFSGSNIPASGGMQPPAPAGPGEYTRMFRPRPAGSEPAEAPVPATKVEKEPENKAKPQQRTKLLPLVIVLAVLVLAAILLLVYILTKHS
jgi:hypothetical protein